MMYILRVSFFLLVFLFHSFVSSEPTIVDVSEKAETVFTEFVTNLLLQGDIANPEEEFDRLINSNWPNELTRATENWTADEARKFLNTLQFSGVQSKSILNILVSTDYLRVLKERSAFRFSTKSARSERLTAGEIFFNYVDNHLGTSELENRMGTEWLTRIFDHTKSWTDRDATEFLNFLEASEVQLDSTLRLLQATDYLEKLREGQINTLLIEPVSLETTQQVNSQDITSNQNAGYVFIERARQYFRTEFEQQQDTKYKDMTYEEAFQKRMGPKWKDRIQKATIYWKSQNARAFLDQLSNRIGTSLTLDRIKTASYLGTIGANYNGFIERVTFYESYIGEDEVTKRLSQSLSGFERGYIEEIKRVIEFLEEYLGSREIIRDMMLKNLAGFSRLNSGPQSQTNLENIQDVIAYLRSIHIREEQIKSMIVDTFGSFVKATRTKLETKRQSLTKEETTGIAFTLNEVDKMIEENLHGFLSANLAKIKEIVTCLKEFGFKDDQIKKMAMRNLQGLSNDPEVLRDKKEALTKKETIGIAFTNDEIDKMIEENLQGFFKADLIEVKKMIEYLQSINFKNDQIKKMAMRNLRGLSDDPKTLKNKKQSLTKKETLGIVFTNDEINKLIEESIEGFLKADLKKAKKIVAYLQSINFEDDQIKKMVIRNLQGFSKVDLQKLKNKRENLTKKETIGIALTLDEIDKMIEESIYGFLQTDLEKVKKTVTYLQEIDFKDDRIKKMTMRNLQGFSNNSEKLKSIRKSLTKKETIGIAFTLDEVDKMIEENIQGFLLADLEKVKEMVTYLRKIKIKEDKIKDMLLRNLLKFSTLSAYELRDMIESIKKETELSKVKEETLMLKIKDMIATQNLTGFYNNFDANLKTLICTQALSN